MGASGRVGRLLRSVWGGDRCGSVDVYWQFRSAPLSGRNAFVWRDASDPDPLRDFGRSIGGIDGLFVFWGACPTGDKSGADDMSANVALVEYAVQAAEAAKIPRVIVASSSAVYGTGKGHAFVESDPLEPIGAYGASKKNMEAYCAALAAAATGIEICCLRIGNIAGADALLQPQSKWTHGDTPVTLDIFLDKKGPQRSYIGPTSLARILADLALFGGHLPPVLNVAAQSPVGMGDLLDAAQIAWVPHPASEPAHQKITLDCSLLARLVPLEAKDAEPAELITQWRRASGHV